MIARGFWSSPQSMLYADCNMPNWSLAHLYCLHDKYPYIVHSVDQDP